MGMAQARLLCVNCEKPTLHGREQFSGSLGCVLTFITGLIFLPVWLLIAAVQSGKPMRCQVCGLEYHESAVRAFNRKKTLARQKAAGQTVVVPQKPPFDWAALAHSLSKIITSVLAALVASYAAIVRDVVRGYRALPEWATPIVWGLGITSPILVVAVLGHYLSWW